MKKFDLDTARGEKLANALEANINEGNLAASLNDILDYYDYFDEIHSAFIKALDQAGANCFAKQRTKDTRITKIKRIFGKAEIHNDMQPFYDFVTQHGQPRPMIEQVLHLGYILNTLRTLCDGNNIVYRIAQRSAEHRAQIINERKEKLPQLKNHTNINLDPGANVEKGLTTMLKNTVDALRENRPSRPSEVYIGFQLIGVYDKHGFACGLTKGLSGHHTISISFVNKEGQKVEADFDVSYPMMRNEQFEETMKRYVKQISQANAAQMFTGRNLA